jgi:hypothetical protein
VRTIRTVAAVAAMISCFAATSFAGAYPHDRSGFMLGFGVGGGSGGIEGGDDREAGVILDLRVGYAIRSDLVVHYESSTWTKRQDTTVGDLRWTLSTHTAAVSFFPRGGGLLLRGGVGFGVGSIELEQNNTIASSDATGFGFLVAAGYEWRLSKMFALGPHVEYTYQDLGDQGTSDVIGGALDFNWYW